MLHYQTIPVTPFQQNCSLVWEDSTMTAAVIDPGGDLDRLTAAAQALGVRIAQIWLTHAHIDHAGGTAALARELQVPIIGPHPADQFWIDALAEQGQRFGFPHAEVFTPTRWLADGDTVQLGAHTLTVRHCPGHTPGHVVFHSAELNRAFVGDVRAGRCGLGGVSTERLLSCFLRPPPLTALCGPPAAVAAAAASAPAVYSSSIPLDLGFALRSPRLNEMTDAWLVSKLSTALRR